MGLTKSERRRIRKDLRKRLGYDPGHYELQRQCERAERGLPYSLIRGEQLHADLDNEYREHLARDPS